MKTRIFAIAVLILLSSAFVLPKACAEDPQKTPKDYINVIVAGGAFATGAVHVKNTHPTRSIKYNITVFEGFQAIGAVKGIVEPGESKRIAEADRSVPGGRITKSFRIYTASYASPE